MHHHGYSTSFQNNYQFVNCSFTHISLFFIALNIIALPPKAYKIFKISSLNIPQNTKTISCQSIAMQNDLIISLLLSPLQPTHENQNKKSFLTKCNSFKISQKSKHYLCHNFLNLSLKSNFLYNQYYSILKFPSTLGSKFMKSPSCNLSHFKESYFHFSQIMSKIL